MERRTVAAAAIVGRNGSRDIRGYLGGLHHPVESIVPGSASDSPKSHEGYEKQMASVKRSSRNAVHITALRAKFFKNSN
jgi:hypothetical protein